MGHLSRNVVAVVEPLKDTGCLLTGCEVGVWEGDTSKRILKHFPELFLVMVDQWKVEDNQVHATTQEDMDAGHQKAVDSTEFAKDRRSIIHKTSVEAAKEIPDGFFDFVFIDADHRYEYIYDDVRAWWPKVRNGGILMGHDYNGTLERRYGGRVWGVKKAVDEFALEMGGLQVNKHPSLVWSIQK